MSKFDDEQVDAVLSAVGYLRWHCADRGIDSRTELRAITALLHSKIDDDDAVQLLLLDVVGFLQSSDDESQQLAKYIEGNLMTQTVLDISKLPKDSTTFTVSITSTTTDTTDEADIFATVVSSLISSTGEYQSSTASLSCGEVETDMMLCDSSSTSDTSHTMTLDNLQRGKTYYYRVDHFFEGLTFASPILTLTVKAAETSEDTTPPDSPTGTGPAQLLTPVDGATVYGSTHTFKFVPNDSAVIDWVVRLGDSALDNRKYLDWRANTGNASEVTATTLPADGSIVRLEFYYKTVADAWTQVNTTFTSAPSVAIEAPTGDSDFFAGQIAPPVIQSPIKVNITDIATANWPSDGFNAGGSNTIYRQYGSSSYDRDIQIDCRDMAEITKPLIVDGYRFIEITGAKMRPEHIADGAIGQKRHAQGSYASQYPWPQYKNVHPRIASNRAIGTTSTHGAALIGCDIDLQGAEGDCHVGNPAPLEVQSNTSSKANFKVYHLYSRFAPGTGTPAGIHSDVFQNQLFQRSGNSFYAELCDVFTPYSGWTIQPHNGIWQHCEMRNLYVDFHDYWWFNPTRAQVEGETGLWANTGGSWAQAVRASSNGGPNMTGRFESLILNNIHYRAPRDQYKAFASVSIGGYDPQIYVTARLDINGNRVQQRKSDSAGGGWVDAPISEWSDSLTLLPGTMDDTAAFTTGTWASPVISLLRAPQDKIGPNYVK